MKLNSSIFYPENYILLGSPYARKSDVDAIISEAKTHHPEKFEGNKDSFVFELRYTEPFDKNFKELKRLQGTAAEIAGRRNEFKGYIVIDLSCYLTHHEEDYLNKILLFLVDMSDFWKYIFLVDDQNHKAARELVGKVLKCFVHDNLSCKVIEAKEEPSVIEQISMICKNKGIVCSAPVKELFRDLLIQNFSQDIISALITEFSWNCNKQINIDALDTFLSKQDTVIRYMMTQKEFNRLISFIEQRKEKWNGEKEAV